MYTKWNGQFFFWLVKRLFQKSRKSSWIFFFAYVFRQCVYFVDILRELLGKHPIVVPLSVDPLRIVDARSFYWSLFQINQFIWKTDELNLYAAFQLELFNLIYSQTYARCTYVFVKVFCMLFGNVYECTVNYLCWCLQLSNNLYELSNSVVVELDVVKNENGFIQCESLVEFQSILSMEFNVYIHIILHEKISANILHN